MRGASCRFSCQEPNPQKGDGLAEKGDLPVFSVSSPDQTQPPGESLTTAFLSSHPINRVGLQKGILMNGDMIGHVIKGRYKLVDERGRGSFATVYIARDL